MSHRFDKLVLCAINAKYIHSNLAIYSLKAYAKEYESRIQLAEYTINHQKEYILEQLYLQKPSVLCFSCYIWNIEYVLDVAREFHKLCPLVPIWVGGPEVSYETETFLAENPFITGVVIGEGEETFLALCDYYFMPDDTQKLEAIAGIAYRKQAAVVRTPERGIMNLSLIPFCYDNIESLQNKIIYYESSRGCPFSCSYCLSSIDKKLRFRDLKLVKEELSYFLEHQVPQVKFVDRTFNCDRKHAMEIWTFIKEHDNGITNFHFEIAADLMNEEELALLATMRPGLIQLEVGVQSTNEVTIQEIHRTMRLEKVKEVVLRLKKQANIHAHLDLIAGLPFEDYATFQKSFNEIYALYPNQLQLGFLKVLKGSYMYEHRMEYGILYHSKPPYEVMRTNWLSYEDILAIKKVEEMVEVYYNSWQYEVTMKLLNYVMPNAFGLFQALGDFYDQKGYLAVSHSRIRRSEILIEFLEEFLLDKMLLDDPDFFTSYGTKEEWKDLFLQALVYDLYYRENTKSRPSFALDNEKFANRTSREELHRYKELCRIHCKNGKQSHIEPFFYHFPMENEELASLPQRLAKPEYRMFDYSNRNPLDHQARVTLLDVIR